MKGDPQTRPAAVNAHHVEAARLALGHAALHSRKLAVLAAIDERTTFHAGRVVVKVDSATRRLEHEPVMMAAAGGVGLPVPAVIAFERGPPGVLLMRHVPAEALRPSRVPQPVRDAGRLLRRLHELPADHTEALGPPRVGLVGSENAPVDRAPSFASSRSRTSLTRVEVTH
ncbi:MAG TPA: phosphotransferase [Candidatus Dormibacteraeota bacterium]|nr:phosphotransferase [Candidatus Dormibacteraeota bacterium]